MLTAHGLVARYGRAQALHGMELSARPGKAVVLLGRSGAGKSTTLKALIGLVRPVCGSVRLAGQEVAGWEPHRIARLGLGYVPEERRIFTELTVAENLDVGRRPPRPGLTPWTVPRLFRLFPSLGAMPHRLAGRMSGGEQQMLSVARTLMGNPAMVLLDEPGEGLAPLVVQQLAEAIAAVKAEGVGVVLAEQNLGFARRLADAAVLIESGRPVWSGSMAALAADPAVQARYLSA